MRLRWAYTVVVAVAVLHEHHIAKAVLHRRQIPPTPSPTVRTKTGGRGVIHAQVRAPGFAGWGRKRILKPLVTRENSIGEAR